MSEQGYYDVTLHTGPGIVQAHVTFPFGQWAELGYWLDEIAPGEQDTLTVTFHPLRPPLHSVRAELHENAGLLDLHPVAGPDMEAVARLEEFSRGLGEIDTTEED